jgi:hypothetical protein
MPEQKEVESILCEELTQVEKFHLAQIVSMPGMQVLVKLANAACMRATQDPIKLSPEAPNYERAAASRVQRARNITEFSDLFFKSVYSHVDSIRKKEADEDKEAVAAVENIFGIHAAVKGTPQDAIMKTFGIHPAKPKKKKVEVSQS